MAWIEGSSIGSLLIVILCFVGLRIAERFIGHRLFEPEQPDCESEIQQLRLQLDEERERNRAESDRKDARIRELERRVEWLIGQLQRSGQSFDSAIQHKTTSQLQMPTKPLLLVCGSDNAMCDMDRQALRRGGISFQRLYAATQATVDDELRRRRQDGTLYPWLHITAHADEHGIHLADGITTPAWWSERIDGIRVVFLAACNTETVADALAGLTTVVFVHEDIDNRDAASFTYAFWRRMREHGDPRQAYNQAIQETPQVAEFTDIRMA